MTDTQKATTLIGQNTSLADQGGQMSQSQADQLDRDNAARADRAQTPAPSTTTEQVVVTGRALTPPVEEPTRGNSREAREKYNALLKEARAKNAEPVGSVDASNAKIVPSIGQPRAQTSEEMRQDQEDKSGSGAVAKASPYPGDPHVGHVRAIALSERQRDAGEFNTEDLTGTTVDGDGKTDTVVVRLLYDWWDGQGVRHPLNTLVEVPMNDGRNLVDQRKAERTDPLR